ncbi:MAG: DeoR family transcriptional regulator [Patescibacteria group bacterium]|nr:DeoR family transcriptional regulator [Patescibacteria group bacterium]
MNDRQKELLKIIVEEYIKTAEPVGSKLLVEKYGLNFSPATVRNDMAELEAQNLIAQPHTSAGRVPTEAGYRCYIKNYVDLKSELTESKKDKISAKGEVVKGESDEKIKTLAKVLAEESGLATFVVFDEHNVFYTGLTNIFSQPEFRDLDLIYDMSRVLDHLSEVMDEIYPEIGEEVEIKIGLENHLAKDCAAVMVRSGDMILGMVGPMRMNYKQNIGLMNFIKSII